MRCPPRRLSRRPDGRGARTRSGSPVPALPPPRTCLSTRNPQPVPPLGRSPMTALARVDAVDQVRHHLNQADLEGRPRPGRPTLVKLTNLTDYAVKTALDRIKEDE